MYFINLRRVVYTESKVSCDESILDIRVSRKTVTRNSREKQSHPVTVAFWVHFKAFSTKQTQTSRIIRETTTLSLQPWSLTNSPAPFCVPCSSLMDDDLHFWNVAWLLMRRDSRHPHDSTFLNEPHNNWRFMILLGWGLSGSRTK